MTTATSTGTPPPGWVPADRRWAGLDRRTVGPALFVLAFALLLNLGAPALDRLVGFDDPVATGDVIALSRGVSFTPVPGWDVESGVRLGDEPSGGAPGSARVTDGDVAVEVTVAPFDGDAAGLVDQIEQTTDALNGTDGLHVTGPTAVVTTAAGDTGLVVRYHSPSTEGVLAAFVHDGTGVQVVATSPPGISDEAVRDIAAMLDSLRTSAVES